MAWRGAADMTVNRGCRSLCVGVVIILLALAGGCAGGAPEAGGHGDGDTLFPKLPKVTGHIDYVTADPANPRHFRTLAITDGDGKQWRFQSEGWAGVSVGHLKDHQIQGAPVTVWYEKQANGALLGRFVGD